MKNKLRAYWYKSRNFGDVLTPVVLEHFLKKEIQLAERNETGKLLGIGSIMPALRPNDIVWGSGYNREIKIKKPFGTTFLAVRGPLTRSMIDGTVPEVYGDPAILMPLIYNPKVEKTHFLGIVPHYVDKELAKKQMAEKHELEGSKFIDIQADWKTVIDEILSCKQIITSSLHGIIAAEAYGIPVIWTKYSDKIIGGEFKFQDYFLGTGRNRQEYDKILPPLENLKKKQDILIKVLLEYYGKN